MIHLILFSCETNKIELFISGYGKGYNMMDKEVSGLNYLPEGLENLDFFGGEDDTM